MACRPRRGRESWFAAGGLFRYLVDNATNGGPARLSWVSDKPAFCVVAARNQLGAYLRRSRSGAAACCVRRVGRAGRGSGVVGFVILFGDIGSGKRFVAGCVGGGDDGRGDAVCELAQRGGGAGRGGIEPGRGH